MASKEDILKVLSEDEILEYYAKMYGWEPGRPRAAFSDPQRLPEKQKTPSMFIFDARNGKKRWHEHASGEGGDCFSFIMRAMNCDFAGALRHIQQDFNII